MRLTLIGRGPSWKECPFDTQELWGTASCLITEGLSDKKYTKVFAFDDDLNAAKARPIAIERNIPLISPFAYATEPWPARDIVKEFRSSYFLNTMTRMIAYAIYLKYTRLHIYGADQGPDWGFQQSKTHMCFWIGMAMGRGLDVRLGRGSLSWTYKIADKPTAEPIPEPEEIGIRAAIHEG